MATVPRRGIQCAVQRQEEMKRKLGCCEINSLNRSRQEIEASKARKRGIQASTWYLRGEIAKTTKCEPTPNGLLAKQLTKTLNPSGTRERTLIVEEGDLPIWASVG